MPLDADVQGFWPSTSPCRCAVSAVALIILMAVFNYFLWRSRELARTRKFSRNDTTTSVKNSSTGPSPLPSPVSLLPRWFGLVGGHSLQIDPEKMVDQMEAWADELGGNYELTMFGKRTVVATNVGDVRRILHLRPALFKRGLSANHFRWPAEKIGMLPSMFLDEDEEWMRSRRLICPSLHGKGVMVMIPSIAHIIGRLITQLEERADAGEVINAIKLFERFTHDCVALAAFGLDADSLRATKGAPCPSFDCMETILKAFMALILKPLSMIGWITLPGLLPWVRHTKRNSKQLQEVVQGAIDVARAANNRTKQSMIEAGRVEAASSMPPGSGNLLRRMVATAEGGTDARRLGNRMAFSDDEITKQVMSLFLGGTVASAMIMSWAMYYLTKNPEMFARCREEALQAAPESDGVVSTGEQVSKLVFCSALIKETLRLRSGSTVLLFHNAEATTLGSGTALEKDTGVIVLTRYASLSEELFTRANDFVPERWIEAERDEALLGKAATGGGESAARHDEAGFLSFGTGPRVCPGQEVAKMESAMTIAAICARFDVALAPGQADPPEEILTYVSGPRAVSLVLTKKTV